MTDASGLVYLRARYYLPELGVFPSLDPVEGNWSEPMSLNRYMYVQGNVSNRSDPTGMFAAADQRALYQWNSCNLQQQVIDCSCIPSSDARHLCEKGAFGQSPCPKPTAQSPVTIFFGGSWGDDPAHQGTQGSAHLEGPDPALQTPVWVSIPGIQVFKYVGDGHGLTAKANQAKSASGFANSNLTVMGYSAGGDSALIFADDYVTNNQGTGIISGVAALGPTATGGMIDGRNLQDSGVLNDVLNNLLNHGVNVYWLDDKAAGGYEANNYRKPLGVNAKFCFDDRSNRQEH